jgi:hypothetical protein
MHVDSLRHLTHSHAFLGEQHDENERRTWLAALVADGWHMSTHATALTISAAACQYARWHAFNPRFAFGTGKLSGLAGAPAHTVLGRRHLPRRPPSD